MTIWPAFEGRKNCLADQLCPAGGEEQELGLGCHIVALRWNACKRCRMLSPMGVPPGSRTRTGVIPALDKGFDEQLDLCALAASLGTLEGDEETCLTRVGHAGIMNVDEQDFRAKQENVFRRG